MSPDIDARVRAFVDRLRARSGSTDALGELEAGRGLRPLWEASDLPAGEFADLLALEFEIERISFAQMMAAEPRLDPFSRRFLRDMAVFPCAEQGVELLAIADPTDRATIQAAAIVLGGARKLRLGSFEDIAAALDQRLEEAQDGVAIEAAPTALDDDIDNLRDLASGAPVVRAVNDLFETAVELRASDIHIEPTRAALVLRMRVDGLLRAVAAPSGVPAQAVISRIKILAGLNIAERRLPQDGAARVRAARAEIDVRVSIMPTQHGESAVIRLLPRDRALLSIDKLGVLAADQERLRRLARAPHGMIIVTGPTGSGKTTTLATVLSFLNDPTRKILTIEDPIEYEIPGICQAQARPSIGLTFAAALRAFVRQDPDVIMVGEIRDPETAHVAIHAALTGHLVLTTLHTETAAAAVPRLLDLGVEAFLLRSTLRGVLAQRLVRQLCERCRRDRALEDKDLDADPRLAAMGLVAGDVVFEPGGCERCGGIGYRGRIGVFELLELSERLRALIGEQSDWESIDKTAIAEGMTTMIADGRAKCLSGLTSAAEVLRVTTVR